MLEAWKTCTAVDLGQASVLLWRAVRRCCSAHGSPGVLGAGKDLGGGENFGVLCVMKWNLRTKSGWSGSGSGFRSKDPSEVQISSTDKDTDEREAKMSKL